MGFSAVKDRNYDKCYNFLCIMQALQSRHLASCFSLATKGHEGDHDNKPTNNICERKDFRIVFSSLFIAATLTALVFVCQGITTV